MRFALFLGRRRACAAAAQPGTACRLLLLLAVTTVSLTSTGCTLSRGVSDYIAYNDDVNDFVLGWRNSVWARQAWHERGYQFDGEPQLGAFGEGFRAGYSDVASGGNGCPPPLPPRKYWNWKYQTPEGQSKVAAWFSGYPHGARAAEEEQAGEYQNIQVSYIIEKQYSPEFESGEMLDLDRTRQPGPLDGPLLEPFPDAGARAIGAEAFQETRRMPPQGLPRAAVNFGPARMPPPQLMPHRQVSYTAPINPTSDSGPVAARPNAWPTE